MKIMGIIEPGRKYLAEVSQDEMEKFMNKYFRNMPRLEVGDTVDLGKGYDFLEQTREVCWSVKELIEKGSRYIGPLTEGIVMMADGGKKK
ncbi:MAG: hypothetical protein A4E60_00170 [Syntrophorhabdus sp. PtaB.Bin047]|nr:MAG: hypothetical protein A4E60_00170 [Syntrophorhabdus sp. PtaB.Bin047]